MYDRSVNGQELHFEASGALKQAALIMRDRETDSWWSIMSSDAIGGEFDGADLVELPVSEKTTWGAWRAKHPESLVLSVDGVEHVENNPYDHYFSSDKTFRDLQVGDDRLAPKASIFSFWIGETPHAAPHAAFEGGAILESADGARFLLHRGVDDSIFASTRAYRLNPEVSADADPVALLARIDAGEAVGAEPVAGFDTFWYNWVAIHPDTGLLE